MALVLVVAFFTDAAFVCVESLYRVRSESCSGSSSKACREKMRRDKLNDKCVSCSFSVFLYEFELELDRFGLLYRFMELGAILDPGRPPRTDKAAILIDATRMVTQLRTESQKLKDTNSDLQDKIKELKVSISCLYLLCIYLAPAISTYLYAFSYNSWSFLSKQ